MLTASLGGPAVAGLEAMQNPHLLPSLDHVVRPPSPQPPYPINIG